MSSVYTAVILYSTVLLVLVMVYGYRRKQVHHVSKQALDEAKTARLVEPASLHPVIDYAKCVGCGSCVSACPEQNVLGLIDRQAHLIRPTNCIGHGACKTACPQDAIALVFGSLTRGVDIPELTPDFQTNIAGLFIAGELGGMGLIKNAIEQGHQAIDAISDYIANQTTSKATAIDCVIVGAGPAGLSAMLGAKQKTLNVITIDQNVAGGTVSHYPRGKLVMTAPADMPLVGKVKFAEVSKEKLLGFWLKLIEKHQLVINQNETLTDIVKNA
ncbi:MAG: 4Fe-4S binding protein, partial [Psychrosphaera sp.]|nr:4Fe-4S binding protein [Psychrosphaera sp.]